MPNENDSPAPAEHPLPWQADELGWIVDAAGHKVCKAGSPAVAEQIIRMARDREAARSEARNALRVLDEREAELVSLRAELDALPPETRSLARAIADANGDPHMSTLRRVMLALGLRVQIELTPAVDPALAAPAMCPEHQIPGANGEPIATPRLGCKACSAWVSS